MIVLDASVVLKWVLRDEAGASAALVWRHRHLEGMERVAVPTLMFYEVANAMVFSGRLTAEQADESWDGLEAMGLAVHSLESGSMLRAMELARTAGTSVYDACYVALAEALGCDFVTADTKLARKLEAVPLECRVRVI